MIADCRFLGSQATSISRRTKRPSLFSRNCPARKAALSGSSQPWFADPAISNDTACPNPAVSLEIPSLEALVHERRLPFRGTLPTSPDPGPLRKFHHRDRRIWLGGLKACDVCFDEKKHASESQTKTHLAAGTTPSSKRLAEIQSREQKRRFSKRLTFSCAARHVAVNQAMMGRLSAWTEQESASRPPQPRPALAGSCRFLPC